MKNRGKQQNFLRGLLTPESLLITKKTTLSMLAWWVVLSNMGSAEAGTSKPTCYDVKINPISEDDVYGHYSGNKWWSAKAKCPSGATAQNISCRVDVWHASGVVNGHFSVTPSHTTSSEWSCHSSHSDSHGNNDYTHQNGNTWKDSNGNPVKDSNGNPVLGGWWW